MVFIGHDDYHRGWRKVRTAVTTRSMNFGDVKLDLDPEFVLLLNGLLREALIQQPANENTAQFCLNYVNGLLNKRSDNTKLGLADLVGVNDDEYKLMFESIENDPDEPNEKPKIRLKTQNVVKNMKNRDQKLKSKLNRSRPQTGRSKSGQKNKSASPRNKVIRLDSPHPNQDIVSSPRQTPPSQNKSPLSPDRSNDPDEEIDESRPPPISWIDDVLEPSKIENPNVKSPLDFDTVHVTAQEDREPSQQGNVDFLDENIVKVASKLSNELLQAVTIEEHEDNVLNTGFNAGNTSSTTGNTKYSSRVECREVPPAPTSVPPAPTSVLAAPTSAPPPPEATHSKSSVETRQLSNVSSKLNSKMTSKSSIQSQRSKSSRNQSANDLITGSNESVAGSSSRPGNSKNGNKKRVSKKVKRKKNSRSSIQGQRSNSELESIHEDVRLETPSTTLETVAETGQSANQNVKNHSSSSRPTDMEHSQSRDHFDAPRRLPPGPMAEEDIESEERFSRMEQAHAAIDRVTMTGQQAGPFPRFQTLPGAIKRRSLELIEQASRLFSSSEKISREESQMSSTSPEKMSKSKSRNTKSRNKSNEQLNKTRSRQSKESLDSNSTLASNSSRFLKRKRSVTSSISNRSQQSQKSQNFQPSHINQSKSRSPRTNQKRIEPVHSSSNPSNKPTTPYYNQEPDETDELTENDEIGESIVSQSQHRMATYKDKNYPPAVLSSTSMDSIDNNNIKDTVNKQYNGTKTKWTSDGSSGYDPEAGSGSPSNVKTPSNRTETESFIKKNTSQDRNIPGKLLSNRTSNGNNSIQGNRSVTGSSSHRSNQLKSASNSLTSNRQLETYKKDLIKGSFEKETSLAKGPSALTVSLLCLTSCAVGAGIAFAFCKYKLKMFKS